ncbi:MAG: MmcQ/YjbR family DNA-binding protein [Saprospiraceae bacterium]|nr:MmcQ/YjbR family DNA-binding protein [Saprospiraceae bacterium]
MSIEELRTYCLKKAGVTEDMPFGESTLVFRIGGKIFLLTNRDSETVAVNLKCDPDIALNLRDRHPEVKPGYHMNKKHWNTVDCKGTLSKSMIFEMIDHSYDLVVSSFSAKQRTTLFNQ